MDVEIVTIGFDSLLDALQAAKIDAIISAYPYDERLTRDVAFSQPILTPVCSWLCARVRPSAAGVGPGRAARVAVEWGSEGDMIGRQLQRDGLALELVPFETPQDAVAALVAGNAGGCSAGGWGDAAPGAGERRSAGRRRPLSDQQPLCDCRSPPCADLAANVPMPGWRRCAATGLWSIGDAVVWPLKSGKPTGLANT